jgi:predicted  nucleic acid-binding Zn-ribbon protein
VSAVVKSEFRWPGDSVRAEVRRLRDERNAVAFRARDKRRQWDEAEAELERIEERLKRAEDELKGAPLQTGRDGE